MNSQQRARYLGFIWRMRSVILMFEAAQWAEISAVSFENSTEDQPTGNGAHIDGLIAICQVRPLFFTALITSCVLTQLVVAGLHALWVKVVCAYSNIQQHVPNGIHSHGHACKANIILWHCSDIFYSFSIVVCMNLFIIIYYYESFCKLSWVVFH